MKVTVTFDVEGVKTKKCSGPCKQILPLEAFAKCRSKRSGRQSNCRACDKLREKLRGYRLRDPKKVMLLSARRRAIKKGLPFSITGDDIVIPAVCPILGIPLQTSRDKACDNSPSLDQIIPGRGYVVGNIEVISWRANMLKSNATVAELEAVLAHIKQQRREC